MFVPQGVPCAEHRGGTEKCPWRTRCQPEGGDIGESEPRAPSGQAVPAGTVQFPTLSLENLVSLDLPFPFLFACAQLMLASAHSQKLCSASICRGKGNMECPWAWSWGGVTIRK
jgi:hypothetical protein